MRVEAQAVVVGVWAACALTANAFVDEPVQYGPNAEIGATITANNYNLMVQVRAQRARQREACAHGWLATSPTGLSTLRGLRVVHWCMSGQPWMSSPQ